MSKVTKTIAALGVVAGLGVAALPLASYAATTDTVTVNAEVGTSMSVSLDKDSVSLNPTAGGVPVSTEDAPAQTITATAITNNTNGYKLTLTDADSTNHYLASGGNHIAPGVPTQGDSFWGVKFGADAESYVSIASAPVINGEATDDAGDTHSLDVGVSASAGQVPGTYTGTLTVTITAGA